MNESIYENFKTTKKNLSKEIHILLLESLETMEDLQKLTDQIIKEKSDLELFVKMFLVYSVVNFNKLEQDEFLAFLKRKAEEFNLVP